MVSVQSVVWTVVSSIAAITLGILSNSGVLVAFGAVGCVDAVGSIALVHHFRHGLRHDELSDHLERVAHRVVLVGLALVGVAAAAGGAIRLAAGSGGEGSDLGIVLAGVSLVVLVLLSARKRTVARRIGSNALLSDSHLSAIGAAQAGIVLLGTAATSALGWQQADAVATIILGCAAVAVAVTTSRSERS